MELYLQPDSPPARLKMLDIQQVDVDTGCFLEVNMPMYVVTFMMREVFLFQDHEMCEVIIDANHACGGPRADWRWKVTEVRVFLSHVRIGTDDGIQT